MAVFRKFLKTKKKDPKIKIKSDGDAPGPSGMGFPGEEAEDFERRRQEWQDELDGMSEFLILKSTEEQKEDGVEQPVDTAYIEDKDGMPVLKAVFDVHHFDVDDIQLSVEDDQLILEARSTDDRETAVFRKTMIRKIDLPKHVDHKMMSCELSPSSILTISMPFHLPPKKKPTGPCVAPIVEDVNGKRKIRMAFMLGPEFTPDDISVDTNGHKLVITASYNAEVGKYAQLVNKREMKKEFCLPDTIEVETVRHTLTPEGRLLVEIELKDEGPYKCEVTTEEVDGASSSST